MREILFRGKEDGCFYYGNLLTTVSNGKLVTVIQENDTLLHTKHLVDPETVGQYTGLKDKNGTKIFEGDVCETTLFNCFSGRQEIVEVINKYGCFRLENEAFLVSFDEARSFESDVEVIGNIYDNPELLEAKHND